MKRIAIIALTAAAMLAASAMGCNQRPTADSSAKDGAPAVSTAKAVSPQKGIPTMIELGADT